MLYKCHSHESLPDDKAGGNLFFEAMDSRFHGNDTRLMCYESL